MLGEMLESVRKTGPLVHNITNYVTANDCANILLACGASPIMADEEEEAEEISALCRATNINLGTLNRRSIPAMLKAGKAAAALGHPVLLDPVGAGASRLRTETAGRLLEEIPFSIVRANMSEIRALAQGQGESRGVDACAEDRVSRENLPQALDFIRSFAKKIGAVVSVSGEIDIITDGESAFCVYNGRSEMSAVTGTGCMLSAMTGAYAGANPGKLLEAAAAAVCAMGVCGELAFERMGPLDGNAGYRNYIIDAVYNLNAETLERRAKIELW